MANTLGNLIIQLTAETSAFARGMQDAKKLSFDTSRDIVDSLKRVGDELGRMKFDSAGEFKKSAEIAGGVVAGLGVAVVASSVIVAKEVAEQVKSMSKLAQSYGLSVEEVSRLRVASKLTGVDMETLTMGLGRLARSAATAAEGGKMQAAAFQSLGVAYADSAGHLRPMNDLLLDVADRFSKMRDGTGKTALVLQLLGRSGAALLPFFNQGNAGLKQMLDLSDQLGLTWSKEDAEGAEVFQERIELLDLKGESLKENFVKGLLPALDALSTAFIRTSAGGSSMAKTLGTELGDAATFLTEKFDWLTTQLAKLLVLGDRFKSWSETKIQWQVLDDQHTQFIKQLETPTALPSPQDEKPGGGNNQPTFPKLNTQKNPDAGLADLLNKARDAYNKTADDALQREISDIEHLKQELQAFAALHPGAIFLDLNDAIEKLDKSVQKLSTSSFFDKNGNPIFSSRQLGGDALKQSQSMLDLPQVPPSLSGSIQAQHRLLELGNDMNEQNRQRLEIFQSIQTPLAKYEQEIQRLNILYADHSSKEYAQALADAKEKILGQLDPMAKLVKEQQDLNAALKAGIITQQEYAVASQKVNNAIDQLNLKTGTAMQGLQIFFRQTQQNAQSWAQMTYDAMQKVASGMENAMSTAFTQMIMGTKTVGQAFTQMGQAILQSIVQALSQMLAQWITTHVAMALVSAIFSKQDAVTESSTGAATNASLATSAAFLGAANAFAFNAWNPTLAAAAAAAALATGLSFAASAGAAGAAGAIASFDSGTGYVPRDGVAMLHEGEAVIPAPTVAQLGTNSSSSSSSTSGDDLNTALLQEIANNTASLAKGTANSIDGIAGKLGTSSSGLFGALGSVLNTALPGLGTGVSQYLYEKQEAQKPLLQQIADNTLKIAESIPPAPTGLLGIFGALMGGGFAEGTGYVPRDGVALIHKGESIIPAPTMDQLRGSSWGAGLKGLRDAFKTPAIGGGHLAFTGAGSSGGASGVSASRMAGPMTFHLHGGNDQASMATAVRNVVNVQLKAAARRAGVRI